MEEACKAMLMHKFVRNPPNSYDTLLGSGGNRDIGLSEVQKQCLAVVRARLRDPTASGKTLMPCSSYRQPRIFGFT